MATLANSATTSTWLPITCRICNAINVIPDDAASAICGNCHSYLIVSDAKQHAYWGPVAAHLADAPAIVGACLALASLAIL